MTRKPFHLGAASAALVLAAGLALAPFGAQAQSFSPGASTGGPIGSQPIANSQAINPATGSVFTIGPIPTGTNQIGTVGLVAGTASIGTVGLNAGTNAIGTVALNAPIPAGTNSIGSIASITGALPAGTNLLGSTNPLPQSGTGSFIPITAGTSSTAAVTAGVKRVLAFKNQSTATIAICPSSVSTPALATAGCVDLPSGSYYSACSGSYCPSEAFNAIASAASSPLTVQSN